MNDADLVRYAVSSGLVDGGMAEASLARHGDGTAALTELIERGVLDRERVIALRQRNYDEMERLGGYRLFEVLGHGGMGVVYRGRDDAGAEYAIKVLSPQLALDRIYQQRFLREAEAAQSVASPFVVRCHGAGIDAGRYWLAMELMRGGNAEDFAESTGGRLPPAQCLAIVRDAAEGLEALHAVGLVHRDLKPANLFLTADGRAKLGDFGIAYALADENETRLTATGRTLGTPAFMAPEQASASPDLDIRADIYSLGATLYCLVTGQAPFIGSSNWLVMSQALANPLPDPRDTALGCPAAIAGIVRGCGALRRDDRYATPSDLRQDLERVIAGGAPRWLPRITATVPALRPVADPRLAERRILIVDDDPLLTRIQQAKFAGAGWTVDVAEDGADALVRIARSPPTVLLLDLVLPVMDGAEIIRRLRRDPRHARLPVVVLSNAYFEEELRSAREAGADLILSKVDHGPRQVLEAVERLIASPTAVPPATPGAAAAAEPITHRLEGGLARSAVPALAAARAALAALGEGPDERGQLLEIANHLRPLSGLAAAARALYAGTLAGAAESFARLLHSWPRHLNPSSLRTLRQATERLAAVFAGAPAPEPSTARALVVDDDAISRNTMLQAVKKVGMQADGCAGAVSALGALAAQRVDVVLGDAAMPGIEAHEFARRARLVGHHRDLPIIFVTGLADSAHWYLADSGDPDDAIAKPFLLIELAVKTLVHLR